MLHYGHFRQVQSWYHERRGRRHAHPTCLSRHAPSAAEAVVQRHLRAPVCDRQLCRGRRGRGPPGVRIFRSIAAEEVPFWADVVLGFRKMTEAELTKFPQHASGHAFTTLKCEGPTYLPWLEKRIKKDGGRILMRQIGSLWELHPSFDVVVNCSGLGSRQLAGDSKIFPVRGQVLKVQAPWVKHFIRDGSGLTYIYPGAASVTLGGTRQEGDWNLSPDAEISRDILARCCALEPSLRGAFDIREKVGLRPSRPGVRLQKELLVRDGQRLPVVHHYGHGAGGFSVHWGTALEAARLVSECVQVLRNPTPKSQL
ncbi:D-aspartate oxidase isoform X2 [Manis pentadactyla]|uniref:D-aspartate oxidase isoform X2 n=1 Tax=Manis pentadactyla TaxID=143292 RepID=UPI00255CC5F5|nr:D-aspartate oxidase isoform X2 [Manis pentadactyla]XP_036758861.2 D-aspartate oxidase isoform X2 [Manis pentadactyla]